MFIVAYGEGSVKREKNFMGGERNGRRESGYAGCVGQAALRLGISSALADYQPFCITRFAQTDAKRLKRRRQNPPSLAMPAGPLHTFSWLTFQVGKDRCKLQVVPKRRRFLLEKRRNTEDIAHQLQCKLRFTKKNTSRRDKLILQRFDRPAARKGGALFLALRGLEDFFRAASAALHLSERSELCKAADNRRARKKSPTGAQSGKALPLSWRRPFTSSPS